MNARQSQLYLAHSSTPEESQDGGGADEYAAEMLPEDAAEYIAALLGSLRSIAVKAQLCLLSDLLSVAEEEAKFHCRA